MEVKNTRWVQKISKIFLITLVFLLFFSSIHAAINEGYQTNATLVDESWLAGILNDNIILTPIVGFALFIASLIQMLLEGASALVPGGYAVMPWVDTILFNAVPILDINFINPNSSSILAIPEIQNTITGIYFTILSLSIAFFSVSVLIMAIKIAISSLAAEKAKYKEALVSWIVALLMLFVVHFFISFVFYLNETLVKVATNVMVTNAPANNAIEEQNVDELTDEIWNSEFGKAQLMAWITVKDLTVKKSFEMANKTKDDLKTYVEENIGLINQINAINSNTLQLIYALIHDKQQIYIPNFNISIESSAGAQLFTLINVVKDNKTEGRIEKINQYIKENPNVSKENLYGEVRGILALKDESSGNFSDVFGNKTDIINAVGSLKNLVKVANGTNISSGSGSAKLPIASLADRLRSNTYTDSDEGGLLKDKISIVDSIIYVMFVVMSVLYFLTYIKRLFFVLILSIMAPLVIVYDFVSKLGKGSANIFSSWVKEFTSLVFIQSIQAFIFAVVISFILSLYGERQENNDAILGLISIIIMGSISKMEGLVSKIFGIKSDIADTSMRGGLKSFMGGMAVMAAGKRLLDNPKKLISGVSGMYGAHKDKVSAIKERNKALKRRFGTVNPDGTQYLGGADVKLDSTSTVTGGDTSLNISGPDGQGSNTTLTGNDNITNKPISAANKMNQKPLNIKDAYAYQAIQDSYEKKIGDAKKKRNESIISTVKGVTETGGAFLGGGAGAILAGTTGEMSQIARAATIGGGAGDKLGEMAVDLPKGATNMTRGIKTLATNYGKVKKLNKEYDNINNEITKRMKDANIDIGSL